MKKLTSILLAMVILALTLSFSSCEMTSEEDLKFFPQPTGIYVTGCASDLMYMIIPETYEGEKVVGITQAAFRGYTAIKVVKIPDTVTEIGNFAFADCTSLKKVIISDSVTKIGVGAFSGCTSLKKVTIGDSVTKISEYAFMDCTSLETARIPDSVTEVGAGAFSGCISLRKIVFEGTKREWASMSKSSHYTDIPEDAVVVCSDGTITLKDNIPI